MEDNIKQLKQDYKKALKSANSKEDKIKIKTDYKSMKRMLVFSNKIIENDNKDMKKFDKVWDKFDKEYQKLGETPFFEEVKEELTDNKQQFEEKKQDRNDYFTYKQDDIQFGDSQCDFCKYNNLNNKSVCIKYPNGKPNNIIKAEVKCEYLELNEKNKNVTN